MAYSYVLDTSVISVSGFGTDARAAITTAAVNATAAGKGLLLTRQYGVLLNDANPAISLPSGCHIKFAEGAQIRVMDTSCDWFHVFLLDHVTNVRIENANIDGNREGNSYSPINPNGNLGMGISMYGGSGHRIISPYIRNCWGDGIYLDNDFPTDVQVFQPRIDACRRNGMSICGGVNVLVFEPYITNINSNFQGANPMSGIDIEPDSNASKLQGIKIFSPRTVNCMYGIGGNLSSLPGSVAQTVDVTVYDHVDVGAVYSAWAWSDLQKGSYSVSGTITSKNPKFVKSAAPLTTNWDNSIVLSTVSPTTIS